MQSTFSKVFIIFAVLLVKTTVCDSKELAASPTSASKLLYPTRRPIVAFVLFQNSTVEIFDGTFENGTKLPIRVLRPIVAFVLFQNSTVEIFDGTFENGTKLPIRVLKSIRATGSTMSIRGNFGASDHIVVGDRFTKGGLDCGEVIMNTPDDTIGVGMWIAPGCAYVFAGQSVQLKISPNVSLYEGYNLLDSSSILQSQSISQGSNIFTAYLVPNTAVTLYADESFGDAPQTVVYCYSKVCQQLNVNVGAPVQPFYIAPFPGVVYLVDVQVKSDSPVSLELLQPVGLGYTFEVGVFNDFGNYTWPDPNNKTCAFYGPFTIRYIGYGGSGMNARTSITMPGTPSCNFIQGPSPSPTTVNPSTTNQPSSPMAVTPTTATTDSMAMTTPKLSSTSVFNPFILIVCLLLCMVQRRTE